MPRPPPAPAAPAPAARPGPGDRCGRRDPRGGRAAGRPALFRETSRGRSARSPTSSPSTSTRRCRALTLLARRSAWASPWSPRWRSPGSCRPGSPPPSRSCRMPRTARRRPTGRPRPATAGRRRARRRDHRVQPDGRVAGTHRGRPPTAAGRPRARAANAAGHDRGVPGGTVDGVVDSEPGTWDTLTDAASRLRRLVDDVGLLSKAEEGKLELDIHPVDPAALAADAVRAASVGFADVGVELRADLEQDASPVPGDRDRLLQVLTNLLANPAATPLEAGRSPSRSEPTDRGGAHRDRHRRGHHGRAPAPRVRPVLPRRPRPPARHRQRHRPDDQPGGRAGPRRRAHGRQRGPGAPVHALTVALPRQPS